MDWMMILKESLPYLVPIVAIIIIAVMKKLGMTGYSPAQVSRVINIILESIGWVEKNKRGLDSIEKLTMATDIAKQKMGKTDLRILHKIGIKDEKNPKMRTFGDSLLAGVQNIFVNSATTFLQGKANKLIKKL
jgi:uncharacterized membrane-anchored protein